MKNPLYKNTSKKFFLPMSNKKTISILGCGWLGKALAESLINKNYIVNGSVTKAEKLKDLQLFKIIPFQLKLSANGITGNGMEDFFNCDSLIISISPGRDENINNDFLEGIKNLMPVLKEKSRQIIFISSTSVYANLNREVKEEDAGISEKNSGTVLLKAENLLTQFPIDATCIRFGGLIGYDRMPAKFLAGKSNLKNGNAPVNLIHRDDCVSILELIIEKEIRNETFNACMDEHPLRREFYSIAAQKAGLPIPQFSDDFNVEFKIVNSEKLKKALGYTFKYGNPMEIL